jgi:hypothetical protein
MSKSKRPTGDSENVTLTFRPVAIVKAKRIMEERGETFSGLCARLINDEYDRLFPAGSAQRIQQDKMLARLHQREKN